MNVDITHVQAFCKDGRGGNPAGVVLDAEHLTTDQRLSVARKVGFSETAFVEKSHVADFKVSFYTPVDEVDFCGHAIVALYTLLWRKNIISAGSYTQELKTGIFRVEVRDDGFVSMNQGLPVYGNFIELDKIRKCIRGNLLANDLKPQIVSTGLSDIFLQIDTLDELNSLDIDSEKLVELNKQTKTIGLHAFTLLPLSSSLVAQTRNFAPLYGITEESATGSANGALACYLYSYGKLRNRDITDLRFGQGYAMSNPSEISVSLQVTNQIISRVQVGGFGEIVGQQEILL